MTDAMIFDAVRTPRGKGKKDGSLHEIKPVDLLAGLLVKLRERLDFDPAQLDDVVMGVVSPVGEQGSVIAKTAALKAGWDFKVAGMQINRFCASGLQAIAQAAHYVMNEGADVAVGGGVESISLTRLAGTMASTVDEELMRTHPELWMAMIETADIVAKRYGVSREYQDEYALRSQQRIAAAQEKGLFKNEIVPLTTKMKHIDKETKSETLVDVTVTRDECNRATDSDR